MIRDRKKGEGRSFWKTKTGSSEVNWKKRKKVRKGRKRSKENGHRREQWIHFLSPFLLLPIISREYVTGSMERWGGSRSKRKQKQKKRNRRKKGRVHKGSTTRKSKHFTRVRSCNLFQKVPDPITNSKSSSYCHYLLTGIVSWMRNLRVVSYSNFFFFFPPFFFYFPFLFFVRPYTCSLISLFTGSDFARPIRVRDLMQIHTSFEIIPTRARKR